MKARKSSTDPLSRSQIRQIVDLMLEDIYKAARDQNMTVLVDEDVKDNLAENGYDEQYGARPLRRLIQRSVEDEIAECFLMGEIKEGDRIHIILKDGKIQVTADQAE